jgi:hypothetical protein
MNHLEQEWLVAYHAFYTLSCALGVTDPYNYNRSRELHTSIVLGHEISPTLSGPDAFELIKGVREPVELKSTISKILKATYNGISVKPTWNEQLEYLKNEKIGKYKYHYWTRYEGSKIVECRRFTSEQILDELVPKIKKQYFSESRRSDPRLGVTISSKEFIKKGVLMNVSELKHNNAYYYRNLKPGEEQHKGPWSEEEHLNFVQVLDEMEPKMWGLFSLKIPGRVGYQCADYYNKIYSTSKLV